MSQRTEIIFFSTLAVFILFIYFYLTQAAWPITQHTHTL